MVGLIKYWLSDVSAGRIVGNGGRAKATLMLDVRVLVVSVGGYL